METKKIALNKKVYNVLVAETEEEKVKGLQDVESMASDEGLLFLYDSPQHLDFWMKDCDLPLSIIFMDEDLVVISNQMGIPNSTDYISEDNAQYVLEINPDASIKPGDEADLLPDLEVGKMYIIGADGKPQGEIQGGERIYSRIASRKIINAAKKAFMSKDDKDYKKLGKIVLNEMKAQDNRDPEYVENKKGE